MIYSLLILSSPNSGRAARHALDFASALLASGHSLHRVFFLDEGAATGAINAVYPQAEGDLQELWAALGSEHSLDLVLCITSALRRGVLDSAEAERHERHAPSCHPAFVISGLGQLVDACASSDRVITFGGNGG